MQTGVQYLYTYLEFLDSGFPAGMTKPYASLTFYDVINLNAREESPHTAHLIPSEKNPDMSQPRYSNLENFIVNVARPWLDDLSAVE